MQRMCNEHKAGQHDPHPGQSREHLASCIIKCVFCTGNKEVPGVDGQGTANTALALALCDLSFVSRNLAQWCGNAYSNHGLKMRQHGEHLIVGHDI